MPTTRPTSAGKLLPVLVAAAIVAATAVLGAGTASACSLVGEDVRVDPSAVAPGEDVTVSGEDIYYFEAPLGADCSGVAPYSGPATVAIVVRGGDATTALELGDVTVGADSAIEPTVLTVPTDVPAGTHSLTLIIEDGASPGRYPARNDITVTQPPTSSSTASAPSATPTSMPATTPAPRSPTTPRFTG